MKLLIENFRNITSETIEGKHIHIQGKNGAGKSNILRSIEWVLFATINGSKTGIVPIKDGEESCRVELTLGETTYDREPGNTNAYLDAMRRPIIFCNLLDQEYFYIKKVISDILITKQAMELFGKYRRGSVDASITAVKSEYTVKNKEFLKIKARTEFLQDEIDKRNNVTVEGMELFETQMAEKKLLAAKYITTDGVDTNELSKKREEYNEQLRHQEKMYAEWKMSLSRCLTDMAIITEKGGKLTNSKCPVCDQKFESKELIEKLRDEFAEKRIESTNIQNTLDSIDIQIKKINTEIEGLTMKINEVQFQNKDVVVSKDTLDKEMATLWEATIKYGEALKLKNDYDDELQESIAKLIALQNDDVFVVNEYISPKGKLNQMLQEKLENLIPEAKIIIIEENDLTGELKSVFKLYVGDIEYRNLSRSQKLGINIVLSNKLIELGGVDYPLLIDDAEMFSTTNINKLKTELQDSGVEYIITKVCNCNLGITTMT